MRKTALFTIAAVVSFALQAGAQSYTYVPAGATSAPFPAINYQGAGPQTVNSLITWSSTNATNQGGSLYGWTDGYGFGSNGFWDSSVGPMIGVNDSYDAYGVTDTMTLAFSSPVAYVGGFFNYFPGDSTPTTIDLYNAAMDLIASYNVTFLTNGATDTGQWLGWFESTADISYLTMTDNYIGATDLSYSATPLTVPEGSGFSMLGACLLAIGLCLGMKKKLAL
ncbi:MAG: hypothetical protein ACRD3N_19320 [Terracidiphilus sp.]